MRTSITLRLLSVLGALAAAGAARAADTSQWKCESCPFEKGTTGTVDAGIGTVSDSLGQVRRLHRPRQERPVRHPRRHRAPSRGGRLLGPRRGDQDLGLDTRAIAAQGGREGQYSLRLGYSEIPRRFTDTASTPFLGSRRRRADAATRVSGGRHRVDAAGDDAAAGRARLQPQALRPRRDLARQRALELQRRLARGRSRRHAAHFGIVLLERFAPGRAARPAHRPGRALDVVRRPRPAGDDQLPALDRFATASIR